MRPRESFESHIRVSPHITQRTWLSPFASDTRAVGSIGVRGYCRYFGFNFLMVWLWFYERTKSERAKEDFGIVN